MQRLIDTQLTAWRRAGNRRPLIVRGARQVGKTYSITAFGRREFADFVCFDFERDRSLHRIFGGDLRADRLLMELEAQCNRRIVPGQTLVLFDEIQACSRALASLRYFYEQIPQLHLIAAGSLLEFAMADQSFPVGRVEFQWMRPLCFEEFLRAAGEAVLLDHLPALDYTEPLPESIHEELLDRLRLYFLVGGMPEAVATFIETRSLKEVASVHTLLCNSYLEDFAKYVVRVDRECVEHVFQQIPKLVGRQIKYRPLYPEKSTAKIKSSLQLLQRSLVVHKVHACNAQGLPLGAGASDKLFKCVFLDIGLMQHLCGIKPSEVLASNDLLDTFRGALAEQFVGQELLVRNGSENEKLYYWSRQARNSSAEVDYVIVRQGRIVPVEIKSGLPGRLRSMQIFLQEHTGCTSGVVLSSRRTAPSAQHCAFRFLPLYMRL